MTKRNIAQKFLLVVFGFVLTVVCLEIVLRIGGAFMERSKRVEVGPHNKDEIVLLCIGESTTALGGRDSWPSQLQRELDRVCPEKHFRVINEGQAGVGSSYFAGKIVPLLEQYKPDAVISMLGINDYDGHLVSNRADMALYWFQRLRVIALFRVLCARISALSFKRRLDQPVSVQKDNEPVRKTEPVVIPEAVVSGKKKAPVQSPARKLVKQGMECRRKGDFDAAIGFYNQAMAEDPNEDWTYIELGNLAFDRDEIEEAEKNFLKAAELNPDYAGSFVDLSRCRIRLKDFEGAEKYLRHALLLDSQSQEVCIAFAGLMREMKRPKDALDFISRARVLGPDTAVLATQEAELLVAVGESDAAGRVFEEACSLSGSDAGHWLRAGRFLNDTGKQEKAIEIFRRAFKKYPDSKELRRELLTLDSGACGLEDTQRHFEALCQNEPNADCLTEFGVFLLYRKKDVAGAKDKFLRALELEPGHEGAVVGLIWAEWESGERQKAGQLADGLDAHGYDAFLARARIFQYLGRRERALENFDKAAALFPSRPEAFVFRAILFRDEGGFSRAEQDFSRALTIAPDSVWAKNEFANMYLVKKEYEEAVRLLDSVLKSEPDNVRANYLKARCLHYAALDNNDKAALSAAEALFVKALGLDPETIDIRLELGACLVAQGGGKINDACVQFEEVLKIDPSCVEAWTGLWQARELQSDTQAVDELAHRLNEWIDREERLDRGFVDERLYGLLAVYFRDTRKDEGLAQKYMLRVRRVRLNYASLVTYENYRKICDAVAAGRARLFCMQYPGRDVGPLVKMLEGEKGITFIDNEQVFADAFNKYSYDEIFTDRFAGDFGHMNALGNSILARSVARHIVKTFCPEKEELL